MTIKPILFNTEMVRAILDWRKTCTRRILKGAIPFDEKAEYWNVLKKGEWSGPICVEYFMKQGSPYKPGDILYVRETWGISNMDDESKMAYIVYRASEEQENEGCREVHLPDEKFEKMYESMAESEPEWRPSIHMPKEAARIWLKVTDVRLERLQEITIDGIRNEGLSSMAVHAGDMEIALKEWELLWSSTIKKSDLDRYGWDANPWVWVIEFERCEKPEGEN